MEIINIVRLLLVTMTSTGFSYAAELWCVENDYLKSEEMISDFMCRTDKNETIFQQCNRYNPTLSNCSHQSFKSSRKRMQEFFNDDDYFYMKVTDPGPWNERICYGSDKIFFNLNNKKQRFILNYILDRHETHEFWLPGRTENFSPAVWRLPGKRWNQPVEQLYDELSPYNCISVNVTNELKPLVAIRNCSDELPMLCVSRENPLIQASCSFGFVALRTIPNQCYGKKAIYASNRRFPSFPNYSDMIGSNAAKYLAAHFQLKSYDRCLLHYDSPKNFSIMLDNNGNLYRIQGYPRSYTCQIESYTLPKGEKTEMFLAFNPAVETLILTVYNRKEIWCDEGDTDDSNEHESSCGIRCFTNADYEQLIPVKIKNLIWEEEKKSMFELKLYGDGPGNYWCEAHSVHDFEFISSRKVIASRKQRGHPFAFFFNLPCSLVNCTRINANMKLYAKTIRQLLTNVVDIHGVSHKFRELHIRNVRVMTVESFVPDDYITVLCHAAVTLKGSSVDEGSEEDENDADDNGSAEMEKLKADQEFRVRRHMKDQLSRLLTVSPYGSSDSVNSTLYCFEEFSPTLNRTWLPTRIETSATTFELCLLYNGLPISRRCVGDFLYGGVWEAINPELKCAKKIGNKFITQNLYQIDRHKYAENEPEKTLTSVETLVNTTNKIIPADLFYLGRIMKSVAKTIKTNVELNQTQSTMNYENDTESVIRIYNNIMDLDKRVVRKSVKLNSTNILLDAFEDIFNTMSLRNDSNGNESHSTNVGNGVIIYRSAKLFALIIDPSVSNYSGVAIVDKVDHDDDFKRSKIRLLFANQSQTELLEKDDLEIATFVPQSLLNRLDEIPSRINQSLLLNRPPLKIVIKIYHNDMLFQEDRDIVDTRVYSRIISVTIPGYDSDLPEVLPLYMRTHRSKINDTNDSCRYWNYSTWAGDGLQFLGKSKSDNNVVLCGCSHLTPFAYLVGGSYNLSVTADTVIITEIHREALDMITILGCSLSLLGITGIVITAIVFDKWREKPTTKVILNFSIAIAFQMILFCFVNTELLTMHLLENEIFSSCIILGACLHYSVLVQFSWMLIIAYLQYKRYVQVLGNTRPPRFFFKAFLLGWCIPIIPVLAVIIVDMKSYIPIDNRDESQICYPAGQALYFGVILPIGLIIGANLVIFLLVLYNIVRGTSEKIRSVDRSSALSQVRLSILLFFLLGFTWIFGLMAAAKISLVFSYLFCLTATLQGFVMFIYFVVLDPGTRHMWTSFIKSLCCNPNNK